VRLELELEARGTIRGPTRLGTIGPGHSRRVVATVRPAGAVGVHLIARADQVSSDREPLQAWIALPAHRR
jgi:hypothetical protein